MLKCKKHPKYQGKSRPRVECKMCGYIYEQKYACERVSHEMDAKFLELLGSPEYEERYQEWKKAQDAEKRLDPPCDARAYASAHRFGGSDAGGRSRG